VQQIPLGKTPLNVSRLCLGTMTFGSQTDEATAASMVDASLDAGINFIDTANKYSDGLSEEILGRILSGRRDKIVLASKVFGKMGDAPDQSGLSEAAIMRAVEESLQRLQTDHLDLYYLHQPDYAVPLEESLAAVDRLVRAGKVRCIGASNYAGWQICRAMWLADKNNFEPVTVMQPMYNTLARGIEQEFLPMCKEFNLATVVYNPLAGGLLTGKHNSSAPIGGTRFDGNRQYLDRYWNQTNFDVIERLRTACQESGRTLVSVALNWILHHSPADCLILGASKMEHLQQNLPVAEEGPLTPEIVSACDDAWHGVRGDSPIYNR
jgi:aryl-alcohol dehydrogenase-like predicted oxidoreductase